jgi:hypothetical protein
LCGFQTDDKTEDRRRKDNPSNEGGSVMWSRRLVAPTRNHYMGTVRGLEKKGRGAAVVRLEERGRSILESGFLILLD